MDALAGSPLTPFVGAQYMHTPTSTNDVGKKPHGYLLYYALTAVNVVTVVASLTLSHMLMSTFTESVAEGAEWADRLGAYTEINTLAQQVNAPGNDIFDSKDTQLEAARLAEAHVAFDVAIEEARADITANIAPQFKREFLKELDEIDAGMHEMVAEATHIFRLFETGQYEKAGSRMATMDRKYAIVTIEISHISEVVRTIQAKAFEEHLAHAASFRRLEYLIGGMIVLMVAGVGFYGQKMQQSMTAMLTRSRQLQAALQDTVGNLERAQTEANAANKAKSDFLANMSHEIRTPMTAILGFAENIAENVTSEEDIENIATIQRNGKYLLTIINDILDISKIEADKMTVEHVDCDPAEIVESVRSLMADQARDKNLGFDVEFEGDIPVTIQSDPTRLRQILINLLGNAIKFTEKGGVRLITRCINEGNNSRMEFDIADTGVGMTEAQTFKLFKPFTQADESTTRKFGGTGLGLTISKGFAELLGGDITIVESEEGVGTRFRTVIATGSLDGVKINTEPASSIEAAKPIKTSTQTDLTGLRILLAEDGPDNQRLITFVLKKAGAIVTLAENGKIAFDLALAAQAEGKPFDCILMDMQMPVMSGFEATAALRDAGYTGRIIALTASAMPRDRKRCLDAGCDEFATKPIDRPVLTALVARGSQPRTAAA